MVASFPHLPPAYLNGRTESQDPPWDTSQDLRSQRVHSTLSGPQFPHLLKEIQCPSHKGLNAM